MNLGQAASKAIYVMAIGIFTVVAGIIAHDGPTDRGVMAIFYAAVAMVVAGFIADYFSTPPKE